MDKEKPIRVIEHKGKHRTETRVFARDIHESYCTQPGCRFKGQPSQQGVCHTVLDKPVRIYLDDVEARAEQMLKELQAHRKRLGTKKYIERLESHVFCTWMNSEFGLDELINLRARVGDLRTLKVKFKQKFDMKHANEVRRLRKKVASLEKKLQAKRPTYPWSPE